MTENTELSISDKQRLDVLVRQVNAHGLAIAQALAEIHRDRLYRATHSSFEQFCIDVFEISGRTGRRMLAQVAENDAAKENPQVNDRRARPFSLKPISQREAARIRKDRAIETTGTEEPKPPVQADPPVAPILPDPPSEDDANGMPKQEPLADVSAPSLRFKRADWDQIEAAAEIRGLGDDLQEFLRLAILRFTAGVLNQKPPPTAVVGIGGCDHPKGSQRVLGYGTVCDKCHTLIKRKAG